MSEDPSPYGPPQRLTDDALTRIEHGAGETERSLVTEIRRLQWLLDRVYSHVNETPGQEELLAELEMEVSAIRTERRRRESH